MGWDYVSELRLPTVLLFISQVIEYISMENRDGMIFTEENFWFVHQNSLENLPEVICYHAGGTSEGNEEFGLAKYVCSYFPSDFTWVKSYDMGANVVTSPPKKGVLRTFTALKIHRLGRGWILETSVQW
jgi:hypothetical protein